MQDQLNASECSKYLKALGDPERLRIVQCLQDGPKTVGELSRQLEEALQKFRGDILQTPPTYSAMKVDGRRAYDLARRGNDVKLEPRPVKIYALELIEYQWPYVKLKIDCGRGTYIRAIARDLGEALACGGYLTELTRTKVGSFTLDDATSLEQIEQGPIESFIRQLS